MKVIAFKITCRDIWKVYRDCNEFKIAKEYCDNPADLDEINCKEAEFLFKEKKYIEAAEVSLLRILRMRAPDSRFF